ncbi:MAG: general secretion pathway protein GspB [Woeseiaceae bacterium]|nr:general secretion pathway protein GspB [Woeseiaceae bacterium]
MSFILDALKKSENERQQQSDSEFATVPSGSDNPGMPRWLWVLGALLVVNAVVVTGLLLRDDVPAASATDTASVPLAAEPAVMVSPETAAVVDTAPATNQTFAERVDVARQNQAARPAPEPAVISPEPAAEPAVAQPAAVQPAPVAAAQSDDPLLLPSIQEVVANGTLQLPPMHVDIHVYSETPGDSFVFINMNKYRESEQLDEGPVVEEITRDGVVLTHLGTEFFLSRD